MTCVTLLHTLQASAAYSWTKYGKQLGGIKKHLDELNGNAAMDELESVGSTEI